MANGSECLGLACEKIDSIYGYKNTISGRIDIRFSLDQSTFWKHTVILYLLYIFPFNPQNHVGDTAVTSEATPQASEKEEVVVTTVVVVTTEEQEAAQTTGRN